VIFWQIVIIGTGNWHIDLEMDTLLHVSCAGISRDLRKSSTLGRLTFADCTVTKNRLKNSNIFMTFNEHDV
jgi:hypothetical protein